MVSRRVWATRSVSSHGTRTVGYRRGRYGVTFGSLPGVRPRRRTGITKRFTHLGFAQADRDLEPSERQGTYANGKISFSNTEKACENALWGDVEGKGQRLTEGR